MISDSKLSCGLKPSFMLRYKVNGSPISADVNTMLEIAEFRNRELNFTEQTKYLAVELQV